MSGGLNCVRTRSCRRSASWRSRDEELGGDGNARRRDVHRCNDGKLATEVLNRAAMQLTCTCLADPHAKAGFAERQGLTVVPLENLTLTRRQAGHRGAHTHAEILRFVALREFVLLRPPVVPALDELIERYGPVVGARLPLRRGLALTPTVRPSKLVHAADLVQDRPADPQACITLEGNAARRLAPGGGLD